MSSALLNRMVHVHLRVSHRDWLEWAYEHAIHPRVLEYIQNRPDHLWSQPPKHEEPFSSPRSWHMLSDALHEYGEQINEESLGVLAFGCLSPHHAGQFQAFLKQLRSKYQLSSIIFQGLQHRRELEWNIACDCILAKFLFDLKFGTPRLNWTDWYRKSKACQAIVCVLKSNSTRTCANVVFRQAFCQAVRRTRIETCC